MLSRLRRALTRKRPDPVLAMVGEVPPTVVVQNFTFPLDADAIATGERVAKALRVRGV